MRLLSTRIRGLGPFVDTRLDLAALGDALLVAVVGVNGAGKTTALELATLGAVYRTLPTAGGGGSLVSFARERGALVESDIAIRAGRVVRFRQVVDPVSGGGEASIVDVATGEALLTSTKVTEADAWVRAHLPPLDVVTASLFSAQGSGGVLSMKAADRKRLLLRVHGIERIERLAEAAAKRARDAKAHRVTVQARRDEAERACPAIEAGAVEALDAAWRAACDASGLADASVLGYRAKLDEARARDRAVRAHEEALDAARRDLARTREAVLALDTRIANNSKLLADEARIREALATRETRQAELDAADRAWSDAGAAARTASDRRDRTNATLWDYRTRGREAAKRLERARESMRRHEEALGHREALAAATEALRASEGAHEAALGALAAIQSEQAGRSAARIGGLRDGLEGIAHRGFASPQLLAAETLHRDDAQAAAETGYPERLRAAQASERELRAQVARHRTTRDEAAALTAGIDERAPAELLDAEAHRDDVEGEVREAVQRHEAACDEHEAAQAALRGAETALRAAQAALRDVDATLRAWPGDVAARLEQARARLDELAPQHAAASTALDEAIAREAALEASPPPASHLDLALVDLETAEANAKRASAEHRRLDGELAALRARLADAERARARLVELDGELAAADRELARWSRLAADLGKDGVQAHLVDAVGPALSALVNELLHACVSTRWTVTIATTRTIGTGEAREACELRVLDAESGREGGVETFSGGERVLLGEAISLALTVAACRTAGLEAPVLVRDESGAALDADNARRYVAMLRRAAGMVSASRVLLVSHGRDVVAECDAAVRVRDGAIEVVPVEEAYA